MNFRINVYPDEEAIELCFGDVFFVIDGGLRADGKLASLSAWDHPHSELAAAWAAIPAESLDEPANYGFVDLSDFWMLQATFNLDDDELLERVEQAARAVTTHDAMRYSNVVYKVLHRMLQDSRDKNYEEALEIQEEWFRKLTELCEQFGIEPEDPELDE